MTTTEKVMVGLGTLIVLAALFVGFGVAQDLWRMAFDTVQGVKP